MTDTEARKKESVTMTVEDKPLSMLSWGSEAMQDLENVYKRKCSENKDEQAAIWTSMYEKNLGRKVSDLPPWLGPNASEGKFGDPEKTDLASIHKARAAESCEANGASLITAEQRRHRRRHRSRRSGSSDSTTSSNSDHDHVRRTFSCDATEEEEHNDLTQSTED